MKKGTVKERRTARINSRPVRKSCTGRPPRLYLRAVFSGFRRGKTTQNENQALLRIEGVNDRKETPFYQGKRVVYVYRTSNGFRVRKYS
jgi:large subunit ribosomal protein L35Ae